MEQLNMKRYELPSPSMGKLNDIWAWQECLNNSNAQLEHQGIRIQNLELMQAYGTQAWKVYNSFLTKMLKQHKSNLEKQKKTIQEINLNRKTSQVNAGEKIKMLEETWVSLISKNYEIERACLQLESELAELQKQIDSNKN